MAAFEPRFAQQHRAGSAFSSSKKQSFSPLFAVEPKKEERLNIQDVATEAEEALKQAQEALDIANSATDVKLPPPPPSNLAPPKEENAALKFMQGLASKVGKSIADAAVGAATKVADEVKAAPGKLADAAATAAKKQADNIVAEIKAIPGNIQSAAQKKADETVDGILAIPSKLQSAAAQKADETLKEIEAIPGKMADAALTAADKLAEEVAATPGRIADSTQKAVSKAVDEVTAIPKKQLEKLEAMFEGESKTVPQVVPPQPPKNPPPPTSSRSAPKMEIPKLVIPKIEPPKSAKQPEPPKSPPQTQTRKSEINIPDLPKFKAPKIDIPKMELPKIEAPRLDIPKFDNSPPQPTKSEPKKQADNFVFSELSLKNILNQGTAPVKSSAGNDTKEAETKRRNAEETQKRQKIEAQKQAVAEKKRLEDQARKEAENKRKEAEAEKKRRAELARQQQMSNAEAKRQEEMARKQQQAEAQQAAAEAKRQAAEAKRQEDTARRQQQAEAQQAAAEAKRQAAEAKRQAELERKQAAAEKARMEREAALQKKAEQEAARNAEIKAKAEQQRLEASKRKNEPVTSKAPLISFPSPSLRVSPTPKKPVQKLAKAPRGVPTIVRWRLRRDGGISGLVYGSPNFEDGERIETTKIVTDNIDNGCVVETGSGSRYFLDASPPGGTENQANRASAMKDLLAAIPGATLTLTRQTRDKDAKAALEKVEQAKPRSTFSLFRNTAKIEPQLARPSASVQTKPAPQPVLTAPRGVPSITKWKENRDGSITGLIRGSPNFKDGERVTTSPIVSGRMAQGETVQTGSGSRYFLL
jgi:hypothetical protein